MCMICAAIPAAAATGARLSAAQLSKPVEERKPVAKVTGGVIVLLVAASVVYHTLAWRG
ncbi:MAG: hypothetical protein ACOYYF_08565 [Chloroflexota bacterium]|nr:hypothetical protein [Chloroflexota bacterium]MBI5702168.1 hypothetical protein [Chloroflexota bacterium]